MKRILYVEDTQDNRELVCQMLEDLYEVDTANDGEEGSDGAEEHMQHSSSRCVPPCACTTLRAARPPSIFSLRNL